MMIQTVRLTRKKAALAVIAAGTVLAALILILGRGGSGEEPSRPQLTGNAERVAYLQEMGWQVEEEPVTTLQFLLPPLSAPSPSTATCIPRSPIRSGTVPAGCRPPAARLHKIGTRFSPARR